MAAQATATGTLGGTPVAHLLVYVLDRRLTGTLVIEDHRGRKSAVAFQAGTPTKVKLPEPEALLSGVLVDGKLLDRETAEATFEAARAKGKLHGAELLERGLVDPEALGGALGEQVVRKVEWLCTLPPASVFGYYEAQDYLAGFGGPDAPAVEPLSVIWKALRKQATEDIVTTTLARIGDREIRLHPHSRVGRFGFDARERGVVDVLRAKPQPLPTLLNSGLLPEPALRKVLYALVVTRHIDLGGGAIPVGIQGTPSHVPAPRTSVPSAAREAPAPGAPAVTSSAPPVKASAPPVNSSLPPVNSSLPPGGSSLPPGGSSLPPGKASLPPNAEATRFADEVRERTARIGAQNYYQILGVDRTAATSVIQAAFFQLAKRWHPDRLGPEVPKEVRVAATRIFARMTEANQVLTSDEQRQEYERLMKEGGSTSDEQEMVQRVLRAAAAFQKAEVLIRRGNIEEALKQAELAVKNDDEQAEYVALYADLLSQDPERSKSGSYADVVKLVNDAKKRQPQNLKVRMYRARVLKRSGDVATAYKEYRAIVEQDAANVEAAREVRLFQMRRGKTTTDPRKKADADAGVFGKFFKKS